MKYLFCLFCVVGVVFWGYNFFTANKNGEETYVKELIESQEGLLTFKNDKYGFGFKYPKEYQIVPAVYPGPEKVKQGDSITVQRVVDRALGPILWIYLPVNEFNYSANISAQNLDDYARDYKAKYTDVIIHSQERKMINGINAVKQIYSSGHWIELPNGERTFSATSEIEEDHSVRYIFWHPVRGFFIIKTSPVQNINSNDVLDTVANTFWFY